MSLFYSKTSNNFDYPSRYILKPLSSLLGNSWARTCYLVSLAHYVSDNLPLYNSTFNKHASSQGIFSSPRMLSRYSHGSIPHFLRNLLTLLQKFALNTPYKRAYLYCHFHYPCPILKTVIINVTCTWICLLFVFSHLECNLQWIISLSLTVFCL